MGRAARMPTMIEKSSSLLSSGLPMGILHL